MDSTGPETGYLEGLGRRLRAPEKLQLQYLNRLVLHIEQWSYFEGMGPEHFSVPVFSEIFGRIAQIAKDVREGASPPDDWFDLCSSKEERQVMVHVLMFDEVHLPDDKMRQLSKSCDPSLREGEVLELKRMLNHLKLKRLRNQYAHAVRTRPETYEREHKHWKTYEDYGKSVIRETETLFEADSPPT
jgi:hypothetical protein